MMRNAMVVPTTLINRGKCQHGGLLQALRTKPGSNGLLETSRLQGTVTVPGGMDGNQPVTQHPNCPRGMDGDQPVTRHHNRPRGMDGN